MGATGGQRISEVAAGTGFSPSALRFYEGAGLVEPDRSPAGYRLYDERAVGRLRFIARAKRLGLSLDDIRQLIPVWEGDRCVEVAEVLGVRVAAKIVETRSRIAQLEAFAGELQRAGRRLTDAGGAGPCGDSCACASEPPSRLEGPTAEPSTAELTVPATAAPVSIACTLGPSEALDRLGDWHRLVAARVAPPVRQVEDGAASVTVRFDPDPGLAAEAGRLAAAEHACCAFVTFTLHITRHGTELTASVPVAAMAMLDTLMAGAG